MKKLQDILEEIFDDSLKESMFDDSFGVVADLPFVKDFEITGWEKYLGGNTTKIKPSNLQSIFKFPKQQKKEMKELGWKQIKSPDRGVLGYDENLIVFLKKTNHHHILYIYPNIYNFNWPAGNPDTDKYYQGNPPNRIVLRELELMVQYAPIHPYITRGEYSVYTVPDDIMEDLFDKLQIKYSKK